MAISPQQLTIYLYSAHRAVIFAIEQLSCLFCRRNGVLGDSYWRTGTAFRLHKFQPAFRCVPAHFHPWLDELSLPLSCVNWVHLLTFVF